MPRPVYTTSFIRQAITVGAPTVTYTCPTGFIAVARSIDVVSLSINTGDRMFIASSTSPGVNVQFFDPSLISAVQSGVSAHWDGRVAISAGQTFTVAATGVAGHLHYANIVGFLLTAV